jgi:hypothetical protein
MRYEHPLQLSREEILAGLSDEQLDSHDRTTLVLSAIYYLPTESAGDIFLDEFRRATGTYKRNLLNLFQTFYQILGTTYRYGDSLALLKSYRDEENSLEGEISYVISAVEELVLIFSRNASRSN